MALQDYFTLLELSQLLGRLTENGGILEKNHQSCSHLQAERGLTRVAEVRLEHQRARTEIFIVCS